MPNITVEILRGRSIEQRREFAAAVAREAAAILNARREDVRIVFVEVDPADVAHGGILVCDR